VRYKFPVVISTALALSLVIEHHYLHRSCQVMWAFGIEDTVTQKVVGVLTVGKPPSWSVCAPPVGESKCEYDDRATSLSKHVYELNRLWVSDSIPVEEVQRIHRKTGQPVTHRHGLESRFVASCLQDLKKIDPYMVLVSFADRSQGHVGVIYQSTNWLYVGERGGQRDKTGRGVIERTPKYAYVWYADREMAALSKWPVFPYPKREGIRAHVEAG
jgi:hypothetical protein